MKNTNHKINFWGFFLSTLTLLILASCGSTSTSGGNVSTVGNPDFEIPSDETAFYSPATETTPYISASSASSSISSLKYVTTSWDSGNPVYEIFNAFREYTYPDDEGVLDMSNMYKLLFEAGSNYSNAIDGVEELSTSTPIDAPFDFGTNTVSYDFATDNYALAKDGDTTYALMTWIWDESPTMSYGVIEGSFNDVTGELELNMVYLVDYDGDQDYCLRTYISGNSISHEFSVITGKTGSDDDSYSISMIGSGVSQSDSDDDYFLIKIIDNDNLSAYPDGRYYKFSAGADEDELKLYERDGYDLDDIDDPNNYADTIEGMEFFALDGSDHATSVTDFDSDTLTLDY